MRVPVPPPHDIYTPPIDELTKAHTVTIKPKKKSNDRSDSHFSMVEALEELEEQLEQVINTSKKMIF